MTRDLTSVTHLYTWPHVAAKETFQLRRRETGRSGRGPTINESNYPASSRPGPARGDWQRPSISERRCLSCLCLEKTDDKPNNDRRPLLRRWKQTCTDPLNVGPLQIRYSVNNIFVSIRFTSTNRISPQHTTRLKRRNSRYSRKN